MRRIQSTPTFDKKLIKFLKKNPLLQDKILLVFKKLEQDVHTISLSTHKLHGGLSGLFACEVAYDCRLIFSFDKEYIYPVAVGKHTDIY